VLLLAKQLEWGPVWDWGKLWPFALVIIGLPKLLFGDKDGNRGGGVWLTFLGGIFLMHTYHVLSLRRSWPLFIVAFGVSLLFGDDAKRSKPGKGA
jgi:hypothetical protein